VTTVRRILRARSFKQQTPGEAVRERFEANDKESMMKYRSTTTLALAGILCALPLSASAFRGGDPAEFEAIRDEVFVEADANGDGVLSVTEFATFHELMRARMEASRFSSIDADGSGGITLAELEAAKPPRGGRGPQ